MSWKGVKYLSTLKLLSVYFFYLFHFLNFYFRSDELKEHPFFAGLDWQQVYMQKYTPPLIPPRGEVNAADAFDIGSFDEEDTKGIKVNLNLNKLKYNFDFNFVYF